MASNLINIAHPPLGMKKKGSRAKATQSLRCPSPDPSALSTPLPYSRLSVPSLSSHCFLEIFTLFSVRGMTNLVPSLFELTNSNVFLVKTFIINQQHVPYFNCPMLRAMFHIKLLYLYLYVLMPPFKLPNSCCEKINCKVCNENLVEDEYHLLLVCSTYVDDE